LATVVFWLYWICLTVVTHAPTPSVEFLLFIPRLGALQADHLNHFAAYAVLSILANLAFGMPGNAWGWRSILIFLVLAVWAMIDEATQPLFGRVADIADWLADSAGAACGGMVAICLPRIVTQTTPPLP